MKHPKKEFMGYTWVGWLNFFIQLLFVRLAYSVHYHKDHFTLLTGIIPFTGWGKKPFKHLL